MKAKEREMVFELRTKQKLGYGAIAKQVKVSKSTLSRWLKDLPLSEKRILELRREAWGKGEAKRERFRATMRKKRDERDRKIYTAQKKKFTRVSTKELYIAGLMLYAAEGDKKTVAEIAFSNTDWVMVRFFALWLVKYLAVPFRKLRVQLHLYENMDVPKEESFWRRELGMDATYFVKTQVRPVRGAFSYRESFRHGTCKLYVGGVAKKAELMLSIKAFFDTYSKHFTSQA